MKQIKKEYRDKTGEELARVCATAALDTKAEDLVILDVRGLTTFTEYFVIMSGRSTRHVQGLAEAIEGELRSKRVKASKAEGLQDGMWVLLDFDDVVVHIFYHEQRKFYDLEGLWHEAEKVEIQAP
ncbi:ribosomal silencing factor RsfS [Desulfomarina profundi]|uniref:Ribosomal silencing factor RsfS n=1 Tax=Desulfomarina profundi TaxID=2772557 RepID=A0A8D5FN14_9BACT|nr:ribosome silencing factor [Desulfomarina profundi]BCL61229.1 ribosomal silencing factor RsfS [Desulfomarina profundi]